MRGLLRGPVRTTAVVLGVGGAIGLGFASATDEGMARSLYFNRRALPPLVHYRFVDWETRFFHVPAEERKARFERLHEKYCALPADVFLALKGFYCKFGQLVSSFDETMVPKQYTARLKVLQDSMPPEPASVMMEIMEKDLGCKMTEIFSEFSSIPLGAASIGQVHKAKLRDGTTVVCKIQYPSAEAHFHMDMKTIIRFCKLAQPEQLPLFDEIQKQFVNEFDYTIEAKQLRQIHDNMKDFSDLACIPLPIDADHPFAKANGFKNGLVSKHVLVMEFLDGKSLERTQREQLAEMAKEMGKTADELREEMKAKFEESQRQLLREHGGKSDAIEIGPSEQMILAYRNALYVRDLIRNSFAASYNYTFGWLLGGKPIKYEWTTLPLNAPRLLNTMFHVHGHQLLFNGYFNGDPHPGNILCLNDGRLGLIDYGQVKVLDKAYRIKIARLIIALADDDEDKIVRACVDCGYRTKYLHPDCIADWARFSFDRATPDVTEKYGGVALFQEQIQKADPLVHLPSDLVMVFRLSFLLRVNAMGLGYSSGKFSRACVMWKDQALEFLKSENASTEPPPLPEELKLGERYFK